MNFVRSVVFCFGQRGSMVGVGSLCGLAIGWISGVDGFDGLVVRYRMRRTWVYSLFDIFQ